MKNRFIKIIKTLVLCMTLLACIVTNDSLAGITSIYTVNMTAKFGQTEGRSMLEMINSFRQSDDAWYWNSDNKTTTKYNNLQNLTYDYGLEEAATIRAMEVALMFSHTRPDGSTCFTATDYIGGARGENIAAGYSTAKAAYIAWREDNDYYEGQGHRRNMLNPNYKYVGIGHVYYNGTHFWVQEFSTKSSGKVSTAPIDVEATRSIDISEAFIKSKIVTAGESLDTIYVGTPEDLPVVTASILLKDNFGGSADVEVSCNWKVSNTEIAEIRDGKIYGLKTGQITLFTNALGQNISYPITVIKDGEPFAEYNGDSFCKYKNGDVRCFDKDGNPVINDFRCDGTYTYYFQADGTAMKDRLTYHPDGVHVIYFDSEGHEVFSDFANVKKSIAGDAVDDLCFFNVYGFMYVDTLTYDKTGSVLYYINPYGVMERNGWFEFSGHEFEAGLGFSGRAGGYGYAYGDGTLAVNTQMTDWTGAVVYIQGDGHMFR